jgi:hypothetical protein
MGEMAPEPTGKVVQIGPKRVTISDAALVIETKNLIPDSILVYFEDKKYFLNG